MEIKWWNKSDLVSQDFRLLVPTGPVRTDSGSDIILPVHLSPETNAVSMEIRWFKGTELIYQYKNGVSIQELRRGNIALTLRNVQQSDSGDYTYKLFHDRCQKTGVIHLQVRGKLQLLWLIYEIYLVTDTQTLTHKRLSERYKRLMEETKQLSEQGSPLHTSGKLHSNDIQISILQIIISVNITVGCLLVSCT
uniref:Immunoglobulin V-set domain-containing protein n=1 Tax=Sinocyclocheilus rhinocerous TaxID=307959 RepID=A0A673IBT6_9TELE